MGSDPGYAALVRKALSEPESWMIADQVWLELYRLLRNPAVLTQPLGAGEAAAVVSWHRDKSGWLHCAWESGMMDRLASFWKDTSFLPRLTFDLVLALTLKTCGVREFRTRNTKDFENSGFFTLVNPLA